MKISFLTVILLINTLEISFGQQKSNPFKPHPEYNKITDKEWAARLTPEEYRILRQKGTERAFTGKHLNNHDQGTYVCAGCGQPLFSSDTKFESGSGWPSFYKPVADKNVAVVADYSYNMVREEVLCSKCGGHLGHVFDDGPKPTGKRFCMNSGAMKFKKETNAGSKK